MTADQSAIAALGSGNFEDMFGVVPEGVVAEKAPLDPAVTTLRDQVRHLLHVPRLDASIIPYAQATDAVSMLAAVSNSIHSIAPGSVRTCLENANFQGLLASYAFTSDTHTGMSSHQVTVAPVSSLSDGLSRGASPG